MDAIVALAYQAIDQFLLDPDTQFTFPENLPEELFSIETGVFVSLKG